MGNKQNAEAEIPFLSQIVHWICLYGSATRVACAEMKPFLNIRR
jgi:hypothetical protein